MKKTFTESRTYDDLVSIFYDDIRSDWTIPREKNNDILDLIEQVGDIVEKYPETVTTMNGDIMDSELSYLDLTSMLYEMAQDDRTMNFCAKNDLLELIMQLGDLTEQFSA